MRLKRSYVFVGPLVAALLFLAGSQAAAQPLTVADRAWHDASTDPAHVAADPGIWRSSLNPAGLETAEERHPGWVRFAAFDVDGGLHRPQHPTGLQAFQFASEGYYELAGWQLYGGADYMRREDRRVDWSAVSDPHDRMAFAWADSIGGAWYRDHVDLEAALGSPVLLDRFYSGIHVQYAVGQGARRNDPRPLYRTRDLDLVPGVAIDLGNHQLGLNAHLTWTLEENEYGLFTIDDPFVYRLRGVGTFNRSRIVRGERSTSGTRYGGGLQYVGAQGDWAWDLAAQYTTGIDSVREGIRDPSFGGRHAVQEAKLSGALVRSTSSPHPSLYLDAGWWEGRGTDPVFQAVNVIKEEAHARLQFDLRSAGSASSSWRAGLLARADDVRRRDVVRETEWTATTVDLGAHGHVAKPLSSRLRLHLAPEFRYRHPLDSSYQARNPTHLTDELVAPDYEYYATAQWSGRLQVSVGWRSSDATSDRVRFSLHGAYSAAEADLSSNRRALRFTLEIFSR